MLKRLEDNVNQLSDEIGELNARWSEELPELPIGEVESRWSLLQQKDREAEDVKERLRRSVPFLDEKKQAVQSLERNLLEAEKRHIQLDAELRGKEELLAEKEERLQAWIGDRR